MPIEYEKRDGVAYITLNNPAKANIFDKETSDEISAAWIDLWEDRDIRCAILTGAGDTAFLRRPQSRAAREHHRGGARVSAHAAHLLAARRHGARPEDRRRRPHGRSLSARVEAGDRRGERLGGRCRPVHPAVLDRHPHRQRRACAVQVRAAVAGLARPWARREPADQAAALHRCDEDPADRRAVRRAGGAAHRPRQRGRAARAADGARREDRPPHRARCRRSRCA